MYQLTSVGITPHIKLVTMTLTMQVIGEATIQETIVLITMVTIPAIVAVIEVVTILDIIVGKLEHIILHNTEIMTVAIIMRTEVPITLIIMVLTMVMTKKEQ